MTTKSDKISGSLKTQKFPQLAVVRLRRDFPELGLAKGDVGTIVDVYQGPPRSFDVEFSNGKLEDMQPQDIERVHAQGHQPPRPKSQI